MSDEFVNSLDIEDNDEPIDNSTSEIVEPQNIQEPQQSEEQFDLTKELLTLQGIKDINKIKFEDESGAVVEKSILMQDAFVSEDAKLNCVIMDKNTVITPKKVLSGDKTYPLFVGKEIVI